MLFCVKMKDYVKCWLLWKFSQQKWIFLKKATYWLEHGICPYLVFEKVWKSYVLSREADDNVVSDFCQAIIKTCFFVYRCMIMWSVAFFENLVNKSEFCWKKQHIEHGIWPYISPKMRKSYLLPRELDGNVAGNFCQGIIKTSFSV